MLGIECLNKISINLKEFNFKVSMSQFNIIVLMIKKINASIHKYFLNLYINKCSYIFLVFLKINNKFRYHWLYFI